jgi:hypothetical protein
MNFNEKRYIPFCLRTLLLMLVTVVVLSDGEHLH